MQFTDNESPDLSYHTIKCKFVENEPTLKEQKELEALSKASSFHFKLLLGTLVAFGLVFIVPSYLRVIVAISAAALLLMLGISFLNIQFFQRCPRCNKKRYMTMESCRNCGLLFYPKQNNSNDSEWLQ